MIHQPKTSHQATVGTINRVAALLAGALAIAAVGGGSASAASSFSGATRCDATGTYHRLSAADNSWTYARKHAEKEGGHLVVVNSSAEKDCLEGITGGAAWLGGSDLKKDGVWKWVTSQTFWTSEGSPVYLGYRVAYENWAGGEPNGSTGENCLEKVGGGLWNDLPCSSSQYWITEWEARPSSN